MPSGLDVVHVRLAEPARLRVRVRLVQRRLLLRARRRQRRRAQHGLQHLGSSSIWFSYFTFTFLGKQGDY